MNPSSPSTSQSGTEDSSSVDALHHRLRSQLDHIEQQFSAAAAAVASGNALTLVHSSTALQQLAVELAAMLPTQRKNAPQPTPLPKDVQQRIHHLAASISVVRENLSRRVAFVTQALELLVPQESKPTYAYQTPTFGNAMQQPGLFKALAA